MLKVKINDKYTVIQEENGSVKALRYGEPWRDCVGDNLILSMAQEIEELRKNKITTEKIVNLLNELLKLDKEAITELVNKRVSCNENIANHPTVQCTSDFVTYKVGILGILNGIVAIEKTKIAIMIDDDKKDIVGFTELDKK